MPRCAVKWCINNSGRNSKKNSGLSFHVFPRDVYQRQLWTEAVRFERRDQLWMPTKYSVICSIHFTNDDIHTTNHNTRMLSKEAVPICTMVFHKYSNKEEEFILPHEIDFVREERFINEKSQTLLKIELPEVPRRSGRPKKKKTPDSKEQKPKENKQNVKSIKHKPGGLCKTSEIEDGADNALDAVMNPRDYSIQNDIFVSENIGYFAITDNSVAENPKAVRKCDMRLEQAQLQLHRNFAHADLAVEPIFIEDATLNHENLFLSSIEKKQNNDSIVFVSNLKVDTEKGKLAKRKAKKRILVDDDSTYHPSKDVTANNLEDLKDETLPILDTTGAVRKKKSNISCDSTVTINFTKSKSDKIFCPNCGFDLAEFGTPNMEELKVLTEMTPGVNVSDSTQREESNLVQRKINATSKLSLVSISLSEE